MDNFDIADTANYDAVTPNQDGTQSGSLASEVELRASRVLTETKSGQALLRHTGNHARIRLHSQADPSVRYDFAPALASLGSSGTLEVSFDYDIDRAIAESTNGDSWVSFSFGTDDNTSGEPSIRVNQGSTDIGVLVKAGGAVEVFDSGAGAGAGTHSATGTVPVVFTASYDGLGEGDVLTLESVTVNGVETLSSAIAANWESNGVVADGAIYFEIGSRNGGNYIDNFAINAVGVPEPATAVLLGLGACVAAVRRRLG